MPDAIVARLHEWLQAHEAELLSDTQTLLRFPSIESEAGPNAPYGKANRDALDFVLGRAREWGMRTVDLEGHLGYAEFGSGEGLVMSLGHLDVVPVGPGWKHEPFGAEIDGGYIYARGAVDDKGPTMASFYAMRALQEVCPNLPTRMRQAFGCDEESGFGCVARYMETEEAPRFGVAPDSGWPCYHAEKGIADLKVSAPLPKGPFRLVEFRGGQRPNIVIDSAEARVEVDGSVRGEVEAKLADQWDRNVEASWDGSALVAKAVGKASHGSWPFGGDNAAIRLLRFLNELAPLEAQPFYEEVFELTHPSGPGLGIHGRDEVTGDLTSNLGIAWVDGGRIHLLFNIRYPIDRNGARLIEQAKARFAKLGTAFEVELERDSAPLHFPLDHPLVTTICDVVERETGERRAPGTMGGGTYARAIPNTVSIGTGWAGDGAAHETDERLKVEHLFRMSRIYAHILYRLAVL